MSSHFYHSLSLCDWSSAISFTVTGITHNCVGNTTGHESVTLITKQQTLISTPNHTTILNIHGKDRSCLISLLTLLLITLTGLSRVIL